MIDLFVFNFVFVIILSFFIQKFFCSQKALLHTYSKAPPGYYLSLPPSVFYWPGGS